MVAIPGSPYNLGDSLGKGAFGLVYRALNQETAETVAIKQIRLQGVPPAEVEQIMMEIDLLKELKHPNVVNYVGFVKSAEELYIIMEYCENGSLQNTTKKFGKFSEHLAAMYIGQVLDGLVYLHDQGVIHRDIKGANILAMKDGSVKLADFGVATKLTNITKQAVAGSPYWMAPEVVELCGATTKSDIWSVGCLALELIHEIPYGHLKPMSALYRIVQDDHPPFPEFISGAMRDFLMQCFQKDPNLRVSAKKLLKHPWIQASRKPKHASSTLKKIGANWIPTIRSSKQADRELGSRLSRASNDSRLQMSNSAAAEGLDKRLRVNGSSISSHESDATVEEQNEMPGSRRPQTTIVGEKRTAAKAVKISTDLPTESMTPKQDTVNHESHSEAQKFKRPPWAIFSKSKPPTISTASTLMRRDENKVDIPSTVVATVKPTNGDAANDQSTRRAMSIKREDFLEATKQCESPRRDVPALSGGSIDTKSDRWADIKSHLVTADDDDPNWDDDFVISPNGFDEHLTKEVEKKLQSFSSQMSWNRDFSSPEAQKNKRSLSSRMSTTSLSIQLEAPPLPTPNNDRMQKSTHPQSCHLANTTSLPQSQDRPRAPVSEHQTPLRAAKVSEIDRTDQQFASATTTPQRRSVRTSVSDTAWNISSDVTKPTIGVENPNTALCSEALYARLKSLPDPARKTSGGDQTPADQESPSKVPLRHPRPGTSCSVPSSSDRVSEPARFNPLPPRSSSTSPFEQIWRNGTKSDSNRSGLLEKYTSISSHDANDRAAQTKPLVKSHVHKQFVPLEAKLSPSRPQIQNALDREDDNVWDDDFDIGAKPLGVTLKQVESESTLAELDDLSGNSRESRVSFIEPASGRSREFRKDDDEEEDPFSDLADDSSFDSLDALENHRHQKLASTVMTLVGNLKSSERASLVVKSCDQLITILTENPGMKKKLITYHWVLPIVETLEDCIEPDVALKILQLINVSVENSIQVQENLCLLGTIPVIMGYADPMYQAMIRYEAARFVRDVCRTSSITLQMFISCRGLPVLVKMMQTDYDGGDSNKHIVQMAIDSVLSVFELQGATPKNNFCQIFAKHKLLQRISVIFRKLVESENDDRAFLLANKIAQIFVIFSQSDVPVVDVMAEGVCVDTILENLHRAPKGISVLLLKCIKNLSMHPQAATKLVELQCVEHLVGILQSKRLGQHQEVQNQTLNALFNLCRLSPPRLRRAAQAGLLPFLTPFVASKNPLRQFALPILCEVALHASSACSDLLFSSGCVESYLNLLVDAYWQKSSLEAILAWLTVDRERVETALSVASGQLLNPFFEAKPAAFESMVDTYHKILVASRLVCKSVSANILFGSKCLERLGREKESPIVMVSLLKILLAVLEYPSFSVAIRLRTSADAPSDAVNVKLYGLANKLSQEGGAILVREMAKRVKQKLLREYMNSP